MNGVQKIHLENKVIKNYGFIVLFGSVSLQHQKGSWNDITAKYMILHLLVAILNTCNGLVCSWQMLYTVDVWRGTCTYMYTCRGGYGLFVTIVLLRLLSEFYCLLFRFIFLHYIKGGWLWPYNFNSWSLLLN